MARINEKKHIEKILHTINVNSSKKQWNCSTNDCDEQSINSHILQKNGIINSIATDNHVYSIEPINIFKWENKSFNEIVSFKKVSTNKILSYPTFCNAHDTNIFKQIEIHPIDFTDYKNNLLFAYRTLHSMKRKEERVLDKESRMYKSQILNSYAELKVLIKMSKQKIDIINTLLELREKEILKMQNDLENETESYNVEVIKYPLYKIAASTALLSLSNNLNYIYINIFPYDNETIILICSPKDETDNWIKDYINDWKDKSDIEIQRKLTSHLTFCCENWCANPELIEGLNQEVKNKLLTSTQTNLFDINSKVDFKKRVEFNLFE